MTAINDNYTNNYWWDFDISCDFYGVWKEANIELEMAIILIKVIIRNNNQASDKNDDDNEDND